MSVSNKKLNSNSGFSLFELIIVIFIIGLVYSLITFSMPKPKENYKLTLLTLKDFMLKVQKNQKSKIKLICFNRCQECTIYKNDLALDVEIDLKLSEDLEVLRRDIYSEIKPIEYSKVEINNREKDVCLEFEVFENGSTSFFIVKNIDKYYSYSSYFGDTKMFRDLDKAIDEIYSEDRFPTSEDDYQ